MINVTNKLKLSLIVLTTMLLTGCNVEKQKIVTLADAENMLFTDNGRMLATGGEGIYEITKNNNIYSKTALYPEDQCQFTGMAQYDDWVFTVCSKGLFKATILAAKVVDEQPIYFEKLADLDGFVLANGIAFSPQGELLIANYNVLGWPKMGVAKLPINHQVLTNSIEGQLNGNAILGDLQHNWLAGNPNGIRVAGNTLFTSEGGSVYKHSMNEQGVVSNRTRLSHHTTITDDIAPLCGGAIVTNFVTGSIYYVDANGYEDKNYRTNKLTFVGPSSVIIPQGNLFSANQLLVTEKGVLGDTISPIGNQISVINLPFNVQELADSCDTQ